MSRTLRPVAVLAIASGFTALAGVQVVSNASPSAPFELTLVSGHPTREMVNGASDYSAGSMGFSGYDLRRLKILEPTLYHVEESYVEPGRIDWERMFVGGLEAVERKVPGFLFHRDLEAGRVSLEIGDFRTVLELERVGSSRQLQQNLRAIISLLVQNLDEADIPTDRTPSADGPTPFAEVEYALINGILETLDPHTLLLPPRDANEMDVENQGEFGGLGITVVQREDRLVVDHRTPGTPAAAAGIQREDVLLRIDGQSTINMDLGEAVDLLRGPVGSPVRLQILREGSEAKDYELQRQVIKLNEVEGALLDGDVGLIAIESFHKHVERELHEVLGRLQRESHNGLRGLVLDLRGNPGGYLNQAVGVADTFLRSGEIVSTVDGQGRKRDLEIAHDDDRTEQNYPVVVLLDSNSASASEVVAGALRNNERAVIIGERSFGKGSVQSLHKFFDDSKLKLTISKYLTPGDRSIQALGIPADIELIPVRVGRNEDDDALVTRMFWRQLARREADLDQSLARMALQDDASAYRLYYLDVPDENADPYRLNLDDYQVKFARDVILGAQSSRRAEILANAGRIVDTHKRRGDAAVLGALQEEGIDWTAGPAYEPVAGELPVRIALELGPGGIVAGHRQDVTVRLTNTTDRPLYQVALMAEDHPVLEGREFLFGKVGPGETRRSTVSIHLVDGYPSEAGTVKLEVRDVGEAPLGSIETEVEVSGRPLPQLAWTWRVVAPEQKLTAGTRAKIALTLENRGTGPTGEALARIRNRSGRDLDIVVGTLRPGSLRLLDGEACSEPDRLTGCQLRLLPGESWNGMFEVDLREAEEPWRLELSISDEEAYDHASVVTAGFYELYEHTEKMQLRPEGPYEPVQRVPPTIQISRAPAPVETADSVSLSGVVEDDTGLKHVLVFEGGDKLFAQASIGGLRSIPFTADADLVPGVNVFTVVAEDVDGFTTTRSVVTYRGKPEKVTQATVPAAE